MNDAVGTAVLTGLARVAGHVARVRRMVEEDRYCIHILMPIASAQTAHARVGRDLAQAHVEHCFAQKIKELMTGFERHAQFRGR